MRKNIVVSMLIIALAAALLGGATFAWFTDLESETVTFQAGTFDLTTNFAEVDFTIAAMAPGDSEIYQIDITNSGSLEMYYRFYFTGAGTLADALQVNFYDEDPNAGGVSIGSEVLSNLLEDADPANKDVVFNWVSFPETLGATLTEDFWIEFSLPTTVTETYQGAQFSGTFVVQATQTANQDAVIQWEN